MNKKKEKSVCVILARSGSKGVKDKNIKRINDIPMIAYSIKAAINADIFDRVIVSTDSIDYQKIAIKYGAESFFLRESYFCQDTTTSRAALKHVVEKYEKHYNEKFTIIVELQCTSPLRNKTHVKDAYALFLKERNRIGADSLYSVFEINHFNPNKLKKINSKNILIPLCTHFLEEKLTRRQDQEKIYARNGAIFMMNRAVLFDLDTRIGVKCVPFIMNEISSINVDTKLDLQVVRALIGEKSV